MQARARTSETITNTAKMPSETHENFVILAKIDNYKKLLKLCKSLVFLDLHCFEKNSFSRKLFCIFTGCTLDGSETSRQGKKHKTLVNFVLLQKIFLFYGYFRELSRSGVKK
jgi:hypothetical protein